MSDTPEPTLGDGERANILNLVLSHQKTLAEKAKQDIKQTIIAPGISPVHTQPQSQSQPKIVADTPQHRQILEASGIKFEVHALGLIYQEQSITSIPRVITESNPIKQTDVHGAIKATAEPTIGDLLEQSLKLQIGMQDESRELDESIRNEAIKLSSSDMSFIEKLNLG